MKPDLNLLTVFVTVARQGSVTAASEKLNLSQPAVSHALNRLRTLVGDPLFTRAERRLVPTPHAARMLETARNVLTDAHALMVPSRFNPHLDHAHFRIGASDYAALTIVPVLIARLRAAAPSVTLEVLPVGPSIFEDLESGRLDLSFWGTAPPAKPFLYSQLFEECFVGLADAQHHIFARSFKDAITLDQFLAYPHLTVSLGDPGISAVDQALTALGRTRRVGATSFSFIGSIATLQGSDFLASAPSRLVRVGTFPSLHKFDLPLKVPPYAYGMIWHPRTNAAQSHIWLRKLTKSAVLSV